MKRLFLTVVASFSVCSLFAQNGSYERYIESIRTNNPAIIALDKELEAQLKGNRTDIAPEDPEAEIAYFLKRNVSFEMNVAQSIDFPTVYINKAKLARLSDDKSRTEYLANLKLVMEEAEQLYVNAVYYNRKLSFVKRNMENAKRLQEYYEKGLESGNVSVLEKNKIEALFLDIATQYRLTEGQRSSNLEAIKNINGGIAIDIPDTLYPAYQVGNVDDFIEHASSIDYDIKLAAIDTLIAQRQIKLSRSEWLPGFKIGYRLNMEEKNPTNGIIAGISIPLWKNTNKVRYAKLSKSASLARGASVRSTVMTNLQSLKNDYLSYMASLDEYHEFMKRTNNVELINKALDAGNISILEYFVELNMWYDISERIMDLENEAALIASKMSLYYRM